MAGSQTKKIGVTTAVAIVVANMVGTGVFTSLGFQLLGLSSPLTIGILWGTGGIIALCGALTYAELASHLPGSGGEYHYLSRLVRPELGFMAAWVSATVGFSAPIALAGMALSKYLAEALHEYTTWQASGFQQSLVASVVVLGIASMHAASLSLGSRFQVFFTVAKVVVIVGLIGVGFFAAADHMVSTTPALVFSEVGSASFATSLIYVSYSYSGWNAATYLSADVENPQRNVPIALVLGTGIVMLLYVGLNNAFLRMAPNTTLAGELEVGAAAVKHHLGASMGSALALLIAILLLSTISAMLMAGPRLLSALGQQVRGLHWLGKTTESGLPVVATVLMTGVSLAFIWTSTFELVMAFSSGVMCLFTMFTTASVFLLRHKGISVAGQRGTFRMPLYPLPAVIFLGLNSYMLYHLAHKEPMALVASVVLVLAGAAVLWFLRIKAGVTPSQS